MKVLEEYSAVLNISVFKKPNSAKKIILKLKKFLLRVINQRTIILSYKLFKAYLKLCDVNQPKIQLE